MSWRGTYRFIIIGQSDQKSKNSFKEVFAGSELFELINQSATRAYSAAGKPV
jgi:hypothetical protein